MPEVFGLPPAVGGQTDIVPPKRVRRVTRTECRRGGGGGGAVASEVRRREGRRGGCHRAGVLFRGTRLSFPWGPSKPLLPPALALASGVDMGCGGVRSQSTRATVHLGRPVSHSVIAMGHGQCRLWGGGGRTWEAQHKGKAVAMRRADAAGMGPEGEALRRAAGGCLMSRVWPPPLGGSRCA